MGTNSGRAGVSIDRPAEGVHGVGFVKPLRRCTCVPMLHDAFARGVLALEMRCSLCETLTCMFLGDG